MAYQTSWIDTCIPEELVDLIVKETITLSDRVDTSEVRDGVDYNIRDSKNTWINDSNWVAGFCMAYVLKANRENWQYDIEGFDTNSMQYTVYGPGEYYNWHQDAGIESLEAGTCRKLSVIMQLSEPHEYEGGEVQMLSENGSLYIAPKKRGTVIVFDSRTRHRVRKVHSGVRKSLVGWVLGPRWK